MKICYEYSQRLPSQPEADSVAKERQALTRRREKGVTDVKAIHVVHAKWCPHCHPTTVEPMEKIATELGIAFFSYDIDEPEQEKKADELVRKFGDWSEDYLIPQVFLETKDGKMRHILTGYSESVELTKRAVSNLLESSYFRGSKSQEHRAR
jgi:thiol-disulfide isomerase/thioredoxin